MFSSVFFQLIERKTMLCEQQKTRVMQKLKRDWVTLIILKKKINKFLLPVGFQAVRFCSTSGKGKQHWISWNLCD